MSSPTPTLPLPATAPGSSHDVVPDVSFREALRIWWKIGWLSFGGPAGQIALMHRELVERRRWISEARFLHALNYCMLLPGPEAQQLATYIGWLLHRTWGGVVAGALFVFPGFLSILALSALYARYGQVPFVTALFFGLKAAVLALVVEALLRISRRALKSRFMVVVAGAAFVAIFLFGVDFPWIVAGAALLGAVAVRVAGSDTNGKTSPDEAPTTSYLIDRLHREGKLAHTKPSSGRALRMTLVCGLLWSAPILVLFLTVGSAHILFQETVFFSQAAVVTFGGAYAVLAFVAQRVVQELHWLAPGEMVDGLALAETTPGPLIMVLQFVGFVAAYRYPGGLDPWVAACLGAVLTTWVTFLPSFLFIFVGGPYVEALRHIRALNGALAAVTAAVVGVILNLSIWFAMHTIFASTHRVVAGPLQVDVPHWASVEPGALVLSVAAMIATLRYKLALGWTLIGCALLGLVWLLLIREPLLG